MRQLVDGLLGRKGERQVERRPQRRAAQIAGHRYRVADNAPVRHAYIEPVLIGLTVIEFGPGRPLDTGLLQRDVWVVVTVQPCCQPWYS